VWCLLLLLLSCRRCRSQGLDHFLWLTHDRGACDWPAEEDPGLANVIKVVHFGWHHVTGKAGVPKGWESQIKNKVGCLLQLKMAQCSSVSGSVTGRRPRKHQPSSVCIKSVCICVSFAA